MITLFLCAGVKPYARCCKMEGLSCEHSLTILLCASVRPYARRCKVEDLSCEHTMITLLLCAGVRLYTRCCKEKGLSDEHTMITLLCAGVRSYARCCKVKGLSDEHTMITLLLCAGVRPYARCCKVKGLSCEYMRAGPSSHFDGAKAEAQCNLAQQKVPLGEYLSFLSYNCTVPWNFAQGIFGLLPPWKSSLDRVVLPDLRCMLGVLVFP